ncbi:MAG: tetratricopeptide repeat protein [Sedimentisphaeraceae bacterium JB056]
MRENKTVKANSHNSKLCIKFTLPVILLLVSAAFASPRATVAEGNELFAKGDYENAQLKYEQALKIDPDCEQAMYNLGVAQMKNGQNEEAADVFMDLASKTSDKRLLSNVQRNIAAIKLKEGFGNIEQTQGKEAIDEKIDSLDSGIDYLSRARQISEESNDIDKGIEAARLQKAALKQLKKQLEEQEKQQQQNKDEMSDKLDELQKEQQELSEQSKQQSEQQSSEENQQQKDSLKQKQQELSDETSQAQQQAQDTSQQDSQMKQANEKMQEAMEKQKQAQKQLEEGDYENAAKSQEEAAEKLREARESLNNEQEQQNEKNKEQQNSEQGEQQQKEQPKEGQTQANQAELDKTAQEILEKEKENKKQRVLIRARQREVEKDW